MKALLLLAVLVPASAAFAHPPPPPDDDSECCVSWRERPARIEWSTWLRLGYGVLNPRDTDAAAARTTSPEMPEEGHNRWDYGIGLEGSLVVTDHGRLGAWAELRGRQGFAGAELVITGAPRKIDMFLYEGEGVLALRGGVGPEHQQTASLAYGYRAPWKLFGSAPRTTRYEIGARIVLTATRAPAEWSSTIGIEFEPVGALRYLLGIRSWY